MDRPGWSTDLGGSIRVPDHLIGIAALPSSFLCWWCDEERPTPLQSVQIRGLVVRICDVCLGRAFPDVEADLAPTLVERVEVLEATLDDVDVVQLRADHAALEERLVALESYSLPARVDALGRRVNVVESGTVERDALVRGRVSRCESGVCEIRHRLGLVETELLIGRGPEVISDEPPRESD